MSLRKKLEKRKAENKLRRLTRCKNLRKSLPETSLKRLHKIITLVDPNLEKVLRIDQMRKMNGL